MAVDEIWNAGFTELAGEIRSRRLSPVELTTIVLDRIRCFDGALHAFATVDEDGALAAARDAEREVSAGRWRGPLHGIPVAVKDVFFTTGIRTGLGSTIYADWQPPFESTATRRLQAAGAVPLGKLTVTEGVYADHHPSIAPPVNPFGADHWTGTSSSGSGVATTAGLCYGTLATDTGGSIRLPAACCGVTGIKPTWGRVSRYGVFPLAESLDHVGTMARTVADAAAMLGAIAGADPADPTAAPIAVPDYLATIDDGIDELTIGIDRAYIARYATPAVIASIDAAAATLAGAGARFVDVRFPAPEDILRGWAVQCAVEAAIAHRDTFPARADAYGARLAALLERGRAATGIDLGLTLQHRRAFNGAIARMFVDIDLLLVPALPVGGPTLDYMASLGEDPAAILAIGPFTAPFNVCGYPTISLPCGASEAGVPLGLQLAGKPFAEDVLIRAGQQYQRATAWHLRRPDLPTAIREKESV